MVLYFQEVFQLVVQHLVLLVSRFRPVYARPRLEIPHHFLKQGNDSRLCGCDTLKGVLYLHGCDFARPLQDVLVAGMNGKVYPVYRPVQLNGLPALYGRTS